MVLHPGAMPARTSSKIARSVSRQSPKKAAAPSKGGKASKLAKAAKNVAKVGKKVGKAVVKKVAAKKKAAALKSYDANAVKATSKATGKWAQEELAQVTAKMA